MFQRKIQSVALMAVAMGAFTVASQAATVCTSPSNCPDLSYNAVGTFVTPAKSGSDLLMLAGEPFHLSVMASEATPPMMTNPACTSKCTYTNVPVVGTIASGLLAGMAIPLSPGTLGTLTLTVAAAGKPDVITLVFPQTVVGEALTITAVIYAPNGSLTTAQNIRPLKSSVTLGPTTGTLTYANTTAMTVLEYASGTLSTKSN